MASVGVSSAALSELNNDLTQLSAIMHEIYDLMHADMRQVNAAWQDSKYEDFVQGYEPQINKCEEISERYKVWCTKVLAPEHDRVVEVEKHDVNGSAGGSMSGVSAASAAASTSASPMASTVGKNRSGSNSTSPKSSAELGSDLEKLINKTEKKSKPTPTESKTKTTLSGGERTDSTSVSSMASTIEKNRRERNSTSPKSSAEVGSDLERLINKTEKKTKPTPTASKNKIQSSNNEKKTSWIERTFGDKKEESISKADQACQDAYGKNWHDYQGVPSEKTDIRQVHFKTSESKSDGKLKVGGSVSGGIKAPIDELLTAEGSLGLSGEYTTGGKTKDNTIEGVANCVLKNSEESN